MRRRGHQARNASEPGVMRLDRCDEQVRVIRPPIIDLVVGDDLIFRLHGSRSPGELLI